jgi:hypothetical protein
MMNKEVVTDPLAHEDLWNDLRLTVARLEGLGATEVLLFFGYAWGRRIYSGPWVGMPVAIGAVPAMIADAEQQGFGSLGDDNLYLTVPSRDVKFLYSHESDIHLSYGPETPFVTETIGRWRANGWFLENGKRG